MALFFVTEGTSQAKEENDYWGFMKNNSGFTSKIEKVEKQLQQNLFIRLRKMEKAELRLQRKMFKKDSLAAVLLFKDVTDRYQNLRKWGIAELGTRPVKSIYLGEMDTLTTFLKFLQNKIPIEATSRDQMEALTEKLKLLQTRINNAHALQTELENREAELKTAMVHLNLFKALEPYRQEVYTCRQQLKEGEDLLRNPKQLGMKLIQMARESALFKDFFRQHSALAQLFNLSPQPSSASGQSTIVPLPGLQTRSDILRQLEQQLGNSADALSRVQQPSALVPNNSFQLSSGPTTHEAGNHAMPDYTPNTQRGKSIWKRLEWGSQLQTTRATYYFPVTTDIGLSLGYKWSDRGVVGIGGSYKLGWGRSWQQIAFSHQGLGLKTYIDWKPLLGSSRNRLLQGLWLSGGAEMNYRSQFRNFTELRPLAPWQRSALAGISKRYVVGSKWQGQMQLLYDFLAARQLSGNGPLLFRIGYKF